VQSDLDGKNPDFEASSSKVHDLTVSTGGVFAITQDGDLHRYHVSSTCAVSGVRRLALFTGSDFLMTNATAILQGDCGGASEVLSETPGPAAIAGDDPYVWYARESGEIVRCTLATCASTRLVLASGQGPITALVVDALLVFWATSDELRARPKDEIGTPGAPITLATGQGLPKTIVPSGGDVYWTNFEGGQIMKAPASGTAPATVVASGLNRPWGLLVTPTYLIFTESGANRVVRMPR
jgi:hypothetical protein